MRDVIMLFDLRPRNSHTPQLLEILLHVNRKTRANLRILGYLFSIQTTSRKLLIFSLKRQNL